MKLLIHFHFTPIMGRVTLNYTFILKFTLPISSFLLFSFMSNLTFSEMNIKYITHCQHSAHSCTLFYTFNLNVILDEQEGNIALTGVDYKAEKSHAPNVLCFCCFINFINLLWPSESGTFVKESNQTI